MTNVHQLNYRSTMFSTNTHARLITQCSTSLLKHAKSHIKTSVYAPYILDFPTFGIIFLEQCLTWLYSFMFNVNQSIIFFFMCRKITDKCNIFGAENKAFVANVMLCFLLGG